MELGMRSTLMNGVASFPAAKRLGNRMHQPRRVVEGLVGDLGMSESTMVEVKWRVDCSTETLWESQG